MVIYFAIFETVVTQDGIQFPAFNVASELLAELLTPPVQAKIHAAYAAGEESVTL